MPKNYLAQRIMAEKRHAKQINNKSFEIFTKLCVKTLHDEFGFGNDRMQRFINAYNANMAKFSADSDNTTNADYAMHRLNEDIRQFNILPHDEV